MTSLIGQYLDKQTLVDSLPKISIKPEELGTTDTYHEEKKY